MTRRLVPLILTAGVLTLAACGSSSGGQAGSRTATTARTPTATATTQTTAPAQPTANKPGPERIPLEPGATLAPASSTAPGNQVDGVKCAPIEQLAYHIHAHLQVYVNGQPRSLPGAIGLLGPAPQQTPAGPFYGAVQCYYWLHTHASDGVIHVESPTARIYTLGNFFDEWRQPLSPDQVASTRGRVTAFLNGKPWAKSPRTIPLAPQALIQLDVGSPVVRPTLISWKGSGL